jgi:hypothetical protein
MASPSTAGLRDSTYQLTYWDQIPADVPRTALQSGLASFAFGLLLSGGALATAAWRGVSGCIATLIDAAIRPLLNLCFRPENRDGYGYWITKIIVVLTSMTLLMGLTAPLFGLTATFEFLTLPLKIIGYILSQLVFEKCGWPLSSHLDAQFYTM